VIDHARHVRIDHDAVEEAARQLAREAAPLPEWDVELHPIGRDEDETATLMLVLDALNFCFWPLPGSGGPRWSVTYRGTTHNGYAALAAALRRATEQDVPLADPDYLAGLELEQVRELLAGDPETQDIPLLEARLANLREAGVALRDRWNGSFRAAIAAAGGSAQALLRDVVAALPSFDDTAHYRGETVRFYKRAQILVADLSAALKAGSDSGALGGQGLGAFDDLDTLTAFADYKVPQMLRRFGMLAYDRELERAIRAYELIPPGDEREVEIRAATIWAVEYLRRALERYGRPLRAFEIDWLLWHASQNLPPGAEPYHRTLTIYY
jgi:hypothetical protein